ncbi:MAG: hypothetical protein H0V45_03155 [Actinobacteria bacterium]|nr:hypothetical protein [Actinomycetota bacterium]
MPFAPDAGVGTAGRGPGDMEIIRQSLFSEVVEAHGGRIGFDSAAGHGSTFWLELPAAVSATAGTGRNGHERKEQQ